MSTKHLSQSITAKPVSLKPTGEITEIEVPAGESHFRISQTGKRIKDQHYIFHLRHPDSILLIQGIVEAAGESSPRLKTEVIHHVPATRAETVIRTLAYQQAAPHYEGLIRIEPMAQGSESYLNHHSLLLGEQAKSWTLPSLEIQADQVKCSHAATVRTITEQDLFYLRSRGINETAAKEMLIKAFLQL